MKPVMILGYMLAISITGCASTEPVFDMVDKAPVLKHVMLPTPATDSDSVVPGIGNVPYLVQEDDTERRHLVVSFDEHTTQPELLHTVHFKTDSHQMSQAEQRSLKNKRHLFNEGVTLSGYADPRGTDNYNQKLSEKRVANVRHSLNELGISTRGECAYGESRIPDILNCEE